MYTQDKTESFQKTTTRQQIPYINLATWQNLKDFQSPAYDEPLGIKYFQNEVGQREESIWVRHGVGTIQKWQAQPDQEIILFWPLSIDSYIDSSEETTTLEVTSKDLPIPTKPGTLKYVENFIGKKLFSLLAKEDKQFLKVASNMFNLGDNVNIDRILQSLSEELEKF